MSSRSSSCFFVSIEKNGFCHLNQSQLTARVQSYTNVTSGDAEALKVALFKHGPVAVSIDASHRSFVFYSSGVYYEPACGKLCSCPEFVQLSFPFCNSTHTSCVFQATPLMTWTTLCLQWDMAPWMANHTG